MIGCNSCFPSSSSLCIFRRSCSTWETTCSTRFFHLSQRLTAAQINSIGLSSQWYGSLLLCHFVEQHNWYACLYCGTRCNNCTFKSAAYIYVNGKTHCPLQSLNGLPKVVELSLQSSLRPSPYVENNKSFSFSIGKFETCWQHRDEGINATILVSST